jgi:Nucleotidyl transferase AbiEii toxin, Type IV TA system
MAVPVVWHAEAISPAARDLVQSLVLGQLPVGFYLAGGTGLALRFGHRRSVDLDFFSRESFDEEALLASLKARFQPSVLSRAPQTLHLLLRDIRVSFIGYPYPLLFQPDRFASADVADARDIACMKLSAVSSRGSRRDFVDLFVTAKEYSLEALLSLFVRKFAGIEYSRLHLLKSLTYFEDAEADPPLNMLSQTPWQEVKDFFTRESAALLSRAPS